MANIEKIRVLVADDSAFMRKVLVSIIDSDGAFEVVGEARDGRDAIEKAARLKPDVIAMDINMPRMDGLEATEAIMSTEPRPIVIVSAESQEGAKATLRALELGAIDFLAKPTSGIDLDMTVVRDELVRKLRIASKVRVIRNLSRATAPPMAARTEPMPAMPARTEYAPMPARTERPPAMPAWPERAPAMPNWPERPPASPGRPERPPMGLAAALGTAGLPVAVLAASTGGPATLMKLLPQFAVGFPAALLVVQHMPGAFTPQFAEQLASVSRLPVRHAANGDVLRAGHVFVCPGDSHMRILAPGRVALDNGPRIAGYRPSIDVTLESVAALFGRNAVVAVLTGMGNDGARGAIAIQEGGGLVLAQDEATSVIFGMPAEAIKTGAVEQVLPLQQIVAAICRRVGGYPAAARAGVL